MKGRQEPTILRTIGRTMDIRDETVAVFLANDGRIDAGEQRVIDMVDGLYRDLEGWNLARLAARAIEDRGIDMTDEVEIAAVMTISNSSTIRRLNDYRRDIGPEAA